VAPPSHKKYHTGELTYSGCAVALGDAYVVVYLRSVIHNSIIDKDNNSDSD